MPCNLWPSVTYGRQAFFIADTGLTQGFCNSRKYCPNSFENDQKWVFFAQNSVPFQWKLHKWYKTQERSALTLYDLGDRCCQKRKDFHLTDLLSNWPLPWSNLCTSWHLLSTLASCIPVTSCPRSTWRQSFLPPSGLARPSQKRRSESVRNGRVELSIQIKRIHKSLYRAEFLWIHKSLYRAEFLCKLKWLKYCK